MSTTPPLPGDTASEDALHRMIRVDHAGEYGAVRIYAGQLAALGDRRNAHLIAHMRAQEETHLAAFNALVAERRVRPTALLPLWHVAGYALGAATALMGERAAMACTVAVEEAIDAHYSEQIERLPERENLLRGTLEKFRADEREHRETALAHDAEGAPGYRLLSAVIRTGCRVAIRLSERI